MAECMIVHSADRRALGVGVQGRHEQAAERYREVLRIDRNHTEAFRRLQSADPGRP